MSPSAVLRLCCGAVALAVAVGTASPVTAAPRVVPAAPTTSAAVAAQVRALDREVNRVSAALAASVTRYEQTRDRLARLTRERMAARDAAEARQADAAASRASFDGLARAAYKGSVPPLVAALLSGDPRTVSDLAYVQRSVAALGVERNQLAGWAELRERSAGRALARSDADRRSVVALQQVADAQLAALLAEADRLSARLAVSGDALAAARAQEARAQEARAQEARVQEVRARQVREARLLAAARAAGREPAVPVTGELTGGPAADGTCGPPSTLGEANGFLPASTLCPLSTGRGHRLRTDAAQAFERLQAAHATSFGRPLCVTDSYRSYAAQVDVFARKPSLAAVPGTSQHGWGLAVDLCGGVQNFGSEAHEWMRANAPAFGWHHPRWARQDGSKPEPWHWEFDGG